MRSTLVKFCLLPTLVSLGLAGCNKDPGTETMANPGVTTSGDESSTGNGGQSETGGGGTTTEVTTTGVQPTTSGGTTSGVAETGGSSDTGSGFIPPAETEGPGGTECSVWDQDCPEDQKCMPYADNGSNAWNATKCVPVDRAKGQPGDTCTVEGSAVSGFDSCDKGVLCWDVKPDTMMGTCVAQCMGPEASPSCESDSSCFISNDGVLTLCLPKCDPLTQDCANDNLCIPNPQKPEEFTCVLDASGEEGQTFDPCEYVNSCDKGFYCAATSAGMECDPNSTGCCLPFCDLSEMDAMCPGVGQECVPWYTAGEEPPGLENVGLCSLPG